VITYGAERTKSAKHIKFMLRNLKRDKDIEGEK